jgi:hypothetical protein
MKRLALAASLLLAVTAARVDAGGLPSPKSYTGGPASCHSTPYIRGPEGKVPDPVRDSSRKTHRDLHQAHAVRVK